MCRLFFLLLISCSVAFPSWSQDYLIRGLNFVAPPGPYEKNPMPRISSISVNWIAVVPYAFTPHGGSKVYYNIEGRQWWGERPVGIIKTIELAKEAGLSILLKPQVYIPGQWIGDLQFTDEKRRLEWEADYRDYIMQMVKIAKKYEVESLCIGTEVDLHAKEHPTFWRHLIADIRAQYDGHLTYAANWDKYESIPFWSSLDAIGVDAYFPFTEHDEPDTDELIAHWQGLYDRLDAFADPYDMPYLFTEYGFLSVEGGAGQHWVLEAEVHERAIDEDIQASAIEAVWTAGQNSPRWVGGFLWKWFPNGQGHEGYIERDYTPQDKKAEGVLRRIFEEIGARY